MKHNIYHIKKFKTNLNNKLVIEIYVLGLIEKGKKILDGKSLRGSRRLRSSRGWQTTNTKQQTPNNKRQTTNTKPQTPNTKK